MNIRIYANDFISKILNDFDDDECAKLFLPLFLDAIIYSNHHFMFTLDLDKVWDMTGFSSFEEACSFLISRFKENFDYVVVDVAGLHYMMNFSTFDTMCVLSQTKLGRSTHVRCSTLRQSYNDFCSFKSPFKDVTELLLNQNESQS